MISTWYSQKKNLEILHILSLEKAQDSQELVEISPPEIHWISGTGYDIFTSHVPSSHHHETQKKVPFPKKSHQPFLRNKKALNKGCLHHWLSLNDPLRQTAFKYHRVLWVARAKDLPESAVVHILGWHIQLAVEPPKKNRPVVTFLQNRAKFARLQLQSKSEWRERCFTPFSWWNDPSKDSWMLHCYIWIIGEL